MVVIISLFNMMLKQMISGPNQGGLQGKALLHVKQRKEILMGHDHRGVRGLDDHGPKANMCKMSLVQEQENICQEI